MSNISDQIFNSHAIDWLNIERSNEKSGRGAGRWSHIEHAYYFFLHRNDARRMLCASFETEISLCV